MVPSVLGVDFPFKGFQEEVPHFSRGRVSSIKDFLSQKSPIGTPLPIAASPPDTTPLLPVQKLLDFDWSKYTPIKSYEQRASAERPGWTMFPEFIPASTFSTISCDLLSEIQRHMLEPTIDGGLTWSDLWTKEEVQKFLNNRLSRFFLETGVIQTEFSVDVTSGISEYNYPSDLIQAKRLTFYNPSSLYDGLVSFWPLNEASGTRFDVIGPNDLTTQNGPTTTVGLDSFGGRAIYFTQASSQAAYILDADQTGLNPGVGDMTIAGWVNPTSLTGNPFVSGFICKGANGAGASSPGYALHLYNDNQGAASRHPEIEFGSDVSTFPYCQMHGTNITALGEWTHYVVCYNRDLAVKLYVNGVRTFSLNDGSSDLMNRFGVNTGTTNPAAKFAIGALSQNNGALLSFLDGACQGVGYWNRLLTEDEVAALYNNGEGLNLDPAEQVGEIIILPRVDPFTQDNGSPGWETDEGVPSSIIEEPRRPLSFQLSPTPNVDGSVEGIYVRDPDPIGDACVPLPIPNFLTWIIKYGVMADMLNKEGEANDPQRAGYCESRWKEGIQLTRALLGWGEEEEG